MNAAGGWILSALAVVLVIGALGPLAGIAAGWFLLSPDPVASTGRGAGAGAIGAAATAAGDHLAQEWRKGGPARQRRRTARRDRWWAAGGLRRRALTAEHGLILACRAARSGLQALGRALVVVPAGARAGAEAARSRRNRSTSDNASSPSNQPADQPPNPAAPQSAPSEKTSAQPAPSAASSGPAPAGSTSPQNSGAQPGSGNTTTSGENVTDESTTGAHEGGTELTTTTDLRAEVLTMQGVIEQAQVLGGLLQNWQTNLPEAYTQGAQNGGPHTKALQEAVADVTEAGGDGTAFGEALSAVRVACDQADSLGEHASTLNAEGQTRAYAPS